LSSLACDPGHDLHIVAVSQVMAIMQEDIVKFGVRTRKRNKSIKESAKLVRFLIFILHFFHVGFKVTVIIDRLTIFI
jgi:hypothetical protein